MPPIVAPIVAAIKSHIPRIVVARIPVGVVRRTHNDNTATVVRTVMAVRMPAAVPTTVPTTVPGTAPAAVPAARAAARLGNPGSCQGQRRSDGYREMLFHGFTLAPLARRSSKQLFPAYRRPSYQGLQPFALRNMRRGCSRKRPKTRASSGQP